MPIIPTDVAKLRRRVNITYRDVLENIPNATDEFAEDYLERRDQTDENTAATTNVAQEFVDLDSQGSQLRASSKKQNKKISASSELIASLEGDIGRLNALVKSQQKQISDLISLISEENSLLPQIKKINKEIRNLRELIHGD